MNITITKDDLSTALRRVQGACSGRSVIPALSGVLLRAKDETLEAVASNGDMQISHSVPCGVLGAGEALIPLARLSLFVSQFGPQEISLDVDEKNRATLKSGGATCSLSGLDPKEFFELMKAEKGNGFEIDQSVLKAGLRRTLISVCTNEERFVLCGVHFERKGSTLTLVATSGRRMSIITHEVAGEEIRSTLPTKMANELMRLLADSGSVTAAFGKDTAQFKAGGTTLTSKLISGEFPNWRQVIPKECAERITISREEFLSSLKLVSSAWDEPHKLPTMLLTLGGNRMRMEMVGASADASDSIAVNYSAKEFVAKLAPDQIMDTLAALTDDEVVIEIADDFSPLVIKAKDFLGLTMPIPKGATT